MCMGVLNNIILYYIYNIMHTESKNCDKQQHYLTSNRF